PDEEHVLVILQQRAGREVRGAAAHQRVVRQWIDQQEFGVDKEYETVILRTIKFLLEEPLVERELPNCFARGRLTVLHCVQLAEGDAVGKDGVSEISPQLGLYGVRRWFFHQNEAHLVAPLRDRLEQFRGHPECRGEPQRIRTVEHPPAIPLEQLRRIARREQLEV